MIPRSSSVYDLSHLGQKWLILHTSSSLYFHSEKIPRNFPQGRFRLMLGQITFFPLVFSHTIHLDLENADHGDESSVGIEFAEEVTCSMAQCYYGGPQ